MNTDAFLRAARRMTAFPSPRLRGEGNTLPAFVPWTVRHP